jgi:hypothetical protein
LKNDLSTSVGQNASRKLPHGCDGARKRADTRRRATGYSEQDDCD